MAFYCAPSSRILGIVRLLFREHEEKACAGAVADSDVSFLATRVQVA